MSSGAFRRIAANSVHAVQIAFSGTLPESCICDPDTGLGPTKTKAVLGYNRSANARHWSRVSRPSLDLARHDSLAIPGCGRESSAHHGTRREPYRSRTLAASWGSTRMAKSGQLISHCLQPTHLSGLTTSATPLPLAPRRAPMANTPLLQYQTHNPHPLQYASRTRTWLTILLSGDRQPPGGSVLSAPHLPSVRLSCLRRSRRGRR